MDDMQRFEVSSTKRDGLSRVAFTLVGIKG